ncbi:MAG: BON domain-containing protein [Alphaproteobacteria bacterium]
MIRKIRVAVFVLLAATPLLGGCEPVSLAIGAGAATANAAYQERGIEGLARDTRIKLNILKQWLDKDSTLARQASVEVYEGRALLTGVIGTEDMRADAVGLAWKVEGVTDVLNELVIGKSGGLGELARDSAITTELKTKLTFDEDVLAVNYSVETTRGVVYLIGIAQDTAELDRVIARARDISYVKRVISHVRVKIQDKADSGGGG